jgi:hypothetical protein
MAAAFGAMFHPLCALHNKNRYVADWGLSQTLAQATRGAEPALVSGFINLRETETDRQKPVLLAYRPGAREIKALS